MLLILLQRLRLLDGFSHHSLAAIQHVLDLAVLVALSRGYNDADVDGGGVFGFV